MFRQSGNGPSSSSLSGEVLVTKGSGGTGTDVNLTEVGGDPIALGQTTMADSLPVVVASDQSAIPVTFTPSGTQDVNLQQVGGATVALGQALMAASVPVVIASNQSAVPVSLASAPTTSVTQGTSPWIVAGGGTAGTAATGVVTVQGIASGTNLPVSQATASALNAQAVGNIAHDSADSGNPIKVGNKAIAYGTNPTGVTANDRTDAYANLAGIPFMLGGHPNVLTLRYNATAAETNTKLITVSGGTKIVMLSCTVAADHANTVDVAVRLGFAASTTPTTTGVYLSHPGIAAGSGIRQAGMVAGADGDDFILTSEVPTTGSIDVVMTYFTIEA